MRNLDAGDHRWVGAASELLYRCCGPAAGWRGGDPAGRSRDPCDDLQTGRDRTLSDREIIALVRASLTDTEQLDAESLTASLDDGVVTLSGVVNNLLTHDRALRSAATVRGVRAIDDAITVQPSEVSDTQLARDLAQALALDPATEYWEIKALVDDGFVTLLGSVQSLAEKTLATRVAKSVRGVRGVENEIVIDLPVDRSDEQIAHDVLQLIRWSVVVDAETIEAEVDDGIVILSGHVDTLYEKGQAARLAAVTGAREVDVSDLDVRWTEDDDGPTGFPERTGEELKAAVRMAFSMSPRLSSSFEPEIAIDDRVVT
ncbi:MAG TPA: BON domain-containing protein [Woeseiaceae bacterium]|nr:BON domain-containing protein [Woeseiaceae bacterium]